MTTQCTTPTIDFSSFFGRNVSARFDGGQLTSDAGAVLLRDLEKKINLFPRLAQCFTDYRNPKKVEHPAEQLLRQRTFDVAARNLSMLAVRPLG